MKLGFKNLFDTHGIRVIHIHQCDCVHPYHHPYYRFYFFFDQEDTWTNLYGSLKVSTAVLAMLNPVSLPYRSQPFLWTYHPKNLSWPLLYISTIAPALLYLPPPMAAACACGISASDLHGWRKCKRIVGTILAMHVNTGFPFVSGRNARNGTHHSKDGGNRATQEAKARYGLRHGENCGVCSVSLNG